jgi:hypothetical protein
LAVELGGRLLRAAVRHQALILALQKPLKHVIVAANVEKYIYDLDSQPVAAVSLQNMWHTVSSFHTEDLELSVRSI